jgi:hypothetical protein
LVEDDRRKIDWATLKRLLRYITPYWEVKVILALIVFTTIISTMSPALIGGIVDVVQQMVTGSDMHLGQGV